MIARILLVVAALGIGGCGANAPKESPPPAKPAAAPVDPTSIEAFRQLSPGMERDAVVAILGQPAKEVLPPDGTLRFEYDNRTLVFFGSDRKMRFAINATGEQIPKQE